MVKSGVERRLAAILAADVAGYTRLMSADEEATLVALTTAREIIDGLISDYLGRVFGSSGDSVIAEFASPVEAVRCATEIQKHMEKHNADLAENRRMYFRIGVNHGDVMVKGGDLFGESVNVAARLEALAEPGGIYISDDTFRQIRNKLDFPFEDLGERDLKNVPEPVRVHRIRMDRPITGDEEPAALERKSRYLPEKASIAVLPFVNMSDDAEQEYFSDGIAEDVITDLSKISALFVIARNSTFAYKGKSVKVADVCRELGVRYVLEGSVRKAGNRVRINAQLIDGATGGHLWADRCDGDLTDVFALQDDVTQQIVSALRITLTEDERGRVGRKGTENLEAYDWYLRGRAVGEGHTNEEVALARQHYERAIELDPRFASSYALIAMTHTQDYSNQWSAKPKESLEKAWEMANKAVDLNEEDPRGHFALGLVYLWRHQHDQALDEAKRAISLDPNSVEGHVLFGNIRMYMGEPQDSVDSITKAMRLNPRYPDILLHFLGQAYFALGQNEDAKAALEERISRNPKTDSSRVWLAATYGHLGYVEKARIEWAEALRNNPDYSLQDRLGALPYKNTTVRQNIIDGLRKAGLPE